MDEKWAKKAGFMSEKQVGTWLKEMDIALTKVIYIAYNKVCVDIKLRILLICKDFKDKYRGSSIQ